MTSHVLPQFFAGREIMLRARSKMPGDAQEQVDAEDVLIRVCDTVRHLRVERRRPMASWLLPQWRATGSSLTAQTCKVVSTLS